MNSASRAKMKKHTSQMLRQNNNNKQIKTELRTSLLGDLIL